MPEPLKTLVKLAAMLDPPAYNERGPATPAELQRWQVAIARAREFVEAMKIVPEEITERYSRDDHVFNKRLDAIIRGE